MKKPKKRYQSRAEIEALIDDTRHKQSANSFEGERLRRQAEEIFQKLAVQEIHWDSLSGEQQEQYRNDKAKAVFLLENSERLRNANSRFEKKPARLKATLAVISTETFEFMEDRSVVLQ